MGTRTTLVKINESPRNPRVVIFNTGMRQTVLSVRRSV
jgi:hypothetical protein